MDGFPGKRGIKAALPTGGRRVKQEQKELIRSLRLQGWGYKRIAKELRLNRNQVQL